LQVCVNNRSGKKLSVWCEEVKREGGSGARSRGNPGAQLNATQNTVAVSEA
jgi:hypothetical protein